MLDIHAADLNTKVYLIIESRNWRNGYLLPLVNAARQGRLALEYTDFKDEAEMVEELDKFVNPNKQGKKK